MKKILLLIVSVFAFSLSTMPVAMRAYAEMSEAEKKATEQQLEADKKAEEQRKEAAKKAVEETKKEEEKKRESEKQDAEKKNEELKKACENRRESFKKRMEGIAERSQKRLEVFDKIAERVEAFDTAKNLNVPNFDQLLADVKAKRQAVHDAHDVAKEGADDFDCEKELGKTNVLNFKGALHDEIEAFKAYKTSLKSLISAVKPVAKATEQDSKNESQQ